MRKIASLTLFLFVVVMQLQAQNPLNWTNYSYNRMFSELDVSGDNVWISSLGAGLVKYNTGTGETTFYNRANSNMPDNLLSGICCTSDGRVWVGGNRYGIGLFDGKECQIYNMRNSGLPMNQSNLRMKEDANGHFWVASFQTMARFDGQNWKSWKTGSPLSPWPEIIDFDIDSRGVVWIFSCDGIGVIIDDIYSVVSNIGSSFTGMQGGIVVDKNDVVWIAISEEGLYRYDGNNFTLYNSSNSTLSVMHSDYYTDVAVDGQNRIWLASGNRLARFGETKTEVFRTPEECLYHIKCTKNDTIWCTVLGCNGEKGKLLCFDGTAFTTIDVVSSPMKDNYIFHLEVDKDNRVWINTKKNLVVKSADRFYEAYNRYAEGLAKDNDGNFWVAFNKPDSILIRFSGEDQLVFDTLNSPLDPRKVNIEKLAVDKRNNLWISTLQGLFKYDGNTFTSYNTQNSLIPANEVFTMSFDQDNNLWGGTTNGLFKFDGTNWTVLNTSNSAIPTNIVLGTSFDSQGRLWFSCMDEKRIIGIEYGGGLTCLEGQTMTNYNIYNSGIKSNTSWDVFVDEKDRVWMGSSGAGLMCYDLRTQTWSNFDVTNSGIASTEVQIIKQDQFGNLWLGHINAGVSVFSPDGLGSSLKPVSEEETALILFPNPVQDKLFVRLPIAETEGLRAGIYDLGGKRIHTFTESEIHPRGNLVRLDVTCPLILGQGYVLDIRSKGGSYSGKFLGGEK